MALIYRCDRCRADTTDSSDMANIDLPRYNRDDEIDNEDTFRKQVCRNCLKLVTELLEPQPIVKEFRG